MLRTSLTWFLCVVAATACGDAQDDADDGSSFQEQDSAGITIVENAGAVAREPSGWVVDSTPTLRIGRISGQSPYLFDRITGVHQFADGRIVVVNRGSQELRFFDATGEFVFQVGGEGEGPGEFRQPYLMRSFGPDPVRLFDRATERVTTFSSEGELLDVSRPLGEMKGFTALGAVTT